MRTIGLVLAAAAFVGLSSNAFAVVGVILPTNPGEFNKLAKEFCGPPGQNNLDLAANEFAQARNQLRKQARAGGVIVGADTCAVPVPTDNIEPN